MTQSQDSFNGNQPPLILIHDLFSNTDSWASLVPLLIRRFSVCNFPLSGHPGAQTESTSLVSDTRTRLEHLIQGRTRINIIAHGHASHIALDLAARYPDQIENLVLISPVLSPQNFLSNLPRFLPFFFEFFFLFSDALGEKGFSPRRIAERLGNLPSRFARLWVMEWRRQIPVELNMIQARTLIVAGDRLPRLPDPPVDHINENLTNSHLIRFAGLGHFAHTESPAAIHPILLDFLCRPEGLLEKGIESVIGFMRRLIRR